jgi:predicted transcriptional regulator YdeE
VVYGSSTGAMRMEIKRCRKDSFSIIGKEGSTNDGAGFIMKLWEDADSHFNEVAPLAKKDSSNKPSGIWGAMSDFSRSFNPWEEKLTKGLYLAGVEVTDNAEAPSGWTKWTLPGFEYLYIESGSDKMKDINEVFDYMNKNGESLAGAIQDFTNPAEGKQYMYFPVKRI